MPSSAIGASLGLTDIAAGQGSHYSAQPHYPKPLTAASSVQESTNQELGVRQITAHEPLISTISDITQNGLVKAH
jgi:hypothetical protein